MNIQNISPQLWDAIKKELHAVTPHKVKSENIEPIWRASLELSYSYLKTDGKLDEDFEARFNELILGLPNHVKYFILSTICADIVGMKLRNKENLKFIRETLADSPLLVKKMDEIESMLIQKVLDSNP